MNAMKTNPPSPSKCGGQTAAPCRQGVHPPTVHPSGRPPWRSSKGSLKGITGITGVGIAPSPTDSGGQLILPLAKSLPAPVPQLTANESAVGLKAQEGFDNVATNVQAEFQDREKELLDQICALTTQVNLMRQESMDKDSVVDSLKKQMHAKEMEFEERLATESQAHGQSREELAEVKNLAKYQVILLQKNERLYHEEVEKLHMQHKHSMAAVLEDKGKEIQCLEEKVGKLKQHITDLLNGRSRERQQQLDELRKELTRITRENELMQKKLKIYTSGKEVLKVL